MSRVSISRKTAQLLLTNAVRQNFVNPAWRQALEELAKTLEPKASVVVGRKRVAAKKRTKYQETKDVWSAVMERALGACESCEAQAGPKLQLDHMFGRVRVPQSERNCWALCRVCHGEKTESDPSAAYWLEKFITHATRLGYSEEAGLATRLLGKHQVKAELARAVR